MSSDNLVKSLDRALQIFEVLGSRRGGYGVTEISKEIGLNKTSVYRMLSTFVRHGYVEQDAEKYKLGYKVLELSSALLESIDLRTEAKPFLKELGNVTNEVIHLVVYDRGEVVYIEKLEGNETLRMHSKVGTRAPMHCTGFGKVIMAYLPSAEVAKIIDRQPMEAYTINTIVDKNELLENLQEIKRKGFAYDLEENELGISCIAAPIFEHTGKVVAAVSISGPTMRMTTERLAELQEHIMDIANKISGRLGYRT
ncbi:IclR family transcriptional regulator [Brevibacillus reuszeri]|uniref:Glycerol operon regulatory protein n=1 Tax=Brevibacillus reuszeri TaxID=54915 RepID=A0A0K9YKU9_9BACL|nr:IclR family transcriptional regulator [Brevibacillus reuszeri]KNB68825.1 IclR family transcriptional regulator [Brevibacillus reuszeri]MED1859132.1 IclR family transcriptional regulator [Brevibacillus reuszeri]GED69351.1 IclR family transcriptional regulator [Brevibacillus reuszeri]